MFTTFVLTGLRRQELAGLCWGHVSLVEGTLRVDVAKSEEGERLIALPASLVEELKAQYHVGPRTGRTTDLRFRASGAWGRSRTMHWFAPRCVRRSRRRRSRTGFGIHDLRHTALTNMAATGASPIAVMATAGHRSMSTTKQYIHLAGVVFRDEAGALERRLGLVPEGVPGRGKRL